MKKTLIINIILILCLSIADNYGETTATALDIVGSAYEKNIGYGGVSLFNNIGGLSYNPSIIPNVDSLSGSFTYMDYIYDFKMFYGNLLYPGIGDFNILGKFGYFYMPPIIDVETGDELAYNEFFMGVGTGYRFLNKKLSIGATGNFYTAKIADKRGYTAYLDLGTSYPVTLPVVGYHKLIIGLSLLNLGPGVKFIEKNSSLPFNFNLGIQYIYDYDYKLFTGLRKYNAYDNLLFSLGGEITIVNFLFLRASIIEDINKNLKYNIGMGFDINYTGYHFLIDYAFLPLETVQPSSVITLSFKFPTTGKKEEDSRKNEKNWENLWTSE